MKTLLAFFLLLVAAPAFSQEIHCPTLPANDTGFLHLQSAVTSISLPPGTSYFSFSTHYFTGVVYTPIQGVNLSATTGQTDSHLANWTSGIPGGSVMTSAGTLSTLTLTGDVTSAGGDSVTVYKNGSWTALHVGLSGTSTGSDTTHAISVAAGDVISYQITGNHLDVFLMTLKLTPQ